MRLPAEDDPPASDHGPHTLRVWRGVVVGLFGDDVFVELGPRMQGVISRRQFAVVPAVGEAFDFTLRGQEEGLWSLALSDARPIATWQSLERGSLVHARVIRRAPGGLELKIGPLHAFMPKSHTGIARDEQPDVLVGKTLTCEVIEVDRERQRVVVSRKLVLQRERESEHQRAVGTLKEGAVVQGRVTRIEDYGVFVAFGHGMQGLVHVSNLAHDRVEHPSDVVKLDDVLDLRVLYVKRGGKHIGLGLKQMTESPWSSVERHFYVDQLVEGTVTRIVEFGAFVRVREGIEGLLHASQTGRAHDQPLRSLLAPGQRVSVRIHDLDAEAQRMSLSLLHKNGARISAEEAANAKTFAELAHASAGERLEVSVGELLLRALEASQPRDPGALDRDAGGRRQRPDLGEPHERKLGA